MFVYSITANGINYLQNLTVLVGTDDSTNANSASVCYTYNNGSAPSPGVYLMLTCTQPIVGRYVTVLRLGGTQPTSLQLCDVQVIGYYAG